MFVIVSSPRWGAGDKEEVSEARGSVDFIWSSKTWGSSSKQEAVRGGGQVGDVFQSFFLGAQTPGYSQSHRSSQGGAFVEALL